MDKHTPEFTPEQVDAQVDWLLTRQSPTSPDKQIITGLSQMYQDDERSLGKVWQRLGLEQHLSSKEIQPTPWEETPTAPLPASANVLDLERKRSMRQTGKRSPARVFSLIAAACVAAALVGSLLFVFNLAHQNQAQNPPSVAATGPQNLYASDYYSVFKLDPQTHQVLWKRELKSVLKIIPDGNVVYVEQSAVMFGNKTNAVFGLDARTGKTLWTHTFPDTTSKAELFTRDMAFAQGRLYVGWQQVVSGKDPGRGDPGTAQIYVLNASNGKQMGIYQAGQDVWSMTAGNGVLAVSVAGGLRVYELATGNLLWSKNFPASTNAPVSSLKIANGLVYAIAIAIENNSNNARLRVYRASSGEQVWQSPAFATDQLAFFAVDQHTIYLGVAQYPPAGQKKPATGRVDAYNTQSNKQLWSVPVAGIPHPQLPVMNNGVLYLGVDSGVVDNADPQPAQFAAIDTATGTLKWHQTLAPAYVSAFCIVNGVIYTSTYNVSQSGVTGAKAYTLDHSNGKIQWQGNQYHFFIVVVG